MFDRFERGDKAVLVDIALTTGEEVRSEAEHLRDVEEFVLLVESAGAEVMSVVSGRRAAPEKRYFAGSGKVEEVADVVRATGAEVVIFNHSLSPSQERNLESALQCRVLDRTGLILDIFALRARSHEGKLQVELAQLKHLSTRLVRGWTHLERQKGGIGMRGPGEKQLETDRRLLAIRIKNINKRLEKVQQQRQQGRQARSKAEISTVSLVGYTNAGKSTLFNAVSGARVYAADQLFATLDPTLRRVSLAEHTPVVVADTVGFIRHLPHDLVAAFRSTLLETIEADLLLMVVDVSDEQRDNQIEAVNLVLREIGAQDRPQLIVYNKIDAIDMSPHVHRAEDGLVSHVWLSAQTGQGLDLLIEAMRERLHRQRIRGVVELPSTAAKLRTEFYARGEVMGESYGDRGEIRLSVDLDETEWQRICHGYPDFDLQVMADPPSK